MNLHVNCYIFIFICHDETIDKNSANQYEGKESNQAHKLLHYTGCSTMY